MTLSRRSIAVRCLLILTLCPAPMVNASVTNVNPVTRMSRLQAEIKDDPGNTDAIIEAAHLYISMSDYDGCRRMASQLENIALENPDSVRVMFQARLLLGLVNAETGNVDDALSQLSKARLVAESSGNIHDIVDAHRALGRWYSIFSEDFTSSISHYDAALSGARSIDDPLLLSDVLCDMAEAYLFRCDYSGIRFAQESLIVARETGNKEAILRSLVTFVLLSVHNHAKRQDMETLLSEAKDLQYRYGSLSTGKLELAEATYMKVMEDYASGSALLERVLENQTETLHRLDRIRLLLCYGAILIKEKRYIKAINMYDEALPLCRKWHYDSFILHIYSALAYCYEQMSDYTTAYGFLRSYQMRLDSLWLIEQGAALAKSRVDNEINLNEVRLSRQEAELAMRRKLMIIFASIGCMLLAVIGLMWYFYRRKEVLVRSIVTRENESIAREKLLRHALEQARAQAQAMSEKVAPKPLSEEKVEDLMVRFNELMTEKKAYTDSGITIKSVAEALDTNRTYLSNAINRTFNKSFPQILAEYRVRAAIEMMSDRESDIPLKAIASDVGFSSPSIFYTTFRNVVGMTPAAYRASFK